MSSLLNYIFKEGDSESLFQTMKKLIVDMGNENFNKKMERANELNLMNFSHKQVGEKLISIVGKDLNGEKNV